MTHEPRTDTRHEAAEDKDHGFGRSRPLTAEEQARLAKEQGELIASGRARKGHIVLRTPARRAVFIGGLVGIVVLVLIVTAAA